MLLKFAVENFRSFKDRAELSMVASRITEHSEKNLIVEGEVSILKSAIIYGANASGKSNLLLAMSFLGNFVERSATKYEEGDEILVEPFRLSTETENKPSIFEVTFLHDGSIYTYVVTVTSKEVVRESLDQTKNGTKRLFTREREKVSFHTTFTDQIVYDQVKKTTQLRSNALLLPFLAQLGGKKSIKILSWFKRWRGFPEFEGHLYLNFARRLLAEEAICDSMVKILKGVDLGVESIRYKEDDATLQLPGDMPDDMKALIKKYGATSMEIQTSHKKYDSKNEIIGQAEFNLSENESKGTQKLILLLMPIIEALRKGDIIFVDELDTSLHILLTRFLLKLFHTGNSRNAQIIFSTHDTNLLDRRVFRRDQIWFTEKDRFGGSHIFSLVEYRQDQEKKVRKDASYEKDYLEGRYGAIPFIGDIKELLNGTKKEKQPKKIRE